MFQNGLFKKTSDYYTSESDEIKEVLSVSEHDPMLPRDVKSTQEAVCNGAKDDNNENGEPQKGVFCVM